ncbi:hypothetical protein JYU34_005130 [Plutella xylostella]|uniref:S-adenosylmethionine sensor upstream of mTORC1 n=1 Tax=Plutella xylostella TaxID=51655 RepID=A0ABQ7QVZ2_PLUXY|nr:hypothetical protein JYU34_005130 [Plutella xylostella]
MASDEHKSLAQFVKDVHSSLRQSSSKIGAKRAWSEHCEQKDVLEKYARCMEKLATEHWDVNSSKSDSTAVSRIKWTTDECQDYFINKGYQSCHEKETVIAEKINVKFDQKELFDIPVRLLDVGSCYNPFKDYNFIDVLAIDLCPANSSVMQCDFLNVNIGKELSICENKVVELQENSYEVVTFCFVLEYIPTPELRISACEKAYRLLKPGGLLIINTPDSKHVGANCKIMKCWRYALALMGFSRIKYEKFAHMHCMTFRKSLVKDTAVRWATLHKQEYMEYSLHIPQDKDFNSPKQKTEDVNTDKPS